MFKIEKRRGSVKQRPNNAEQILLSEPCPKQWEPQNRNRTTAKCQTRLELQVGPKQFGSLQMDPDISGTPFEPHSNESGIEHSFSRIDLLSTRSDPDLRSGIFERNFSAATNFPVAHQFSLQINCFVLLVPILNSSWATLSLCFCQNKEIKRQRKCCQLLIFSLHKIHPVRVCERARVRLVLAPSSPRSQTPTQDRKSTPLKPDFLHGLLKNKLKYSISVDSYRYRLRSTLKLCSFVCALDRRHKALYQVMGGGGWISTSFRGLN